MNFGECDELRSSFSPAVSRNITGYFSFHHYRKLKTPPLCLATLNIGEVARSDGGVKKQRQ